MDKFEFLVQEKFNNYSVLDFLRESGISLEIIQKIKRGGVFVNDTLVNNINNLIKEKDVVKIILPLDKVNPYILPIKGQLNIIYEDQYMLAVEKQSGILTHSSKHSKAISLEQLVCGYFLSENFMFRPINRLDKDTSGIVLIAKDMLTASLLNEQMKKGQIKKTYSAIIVGEPKEKHFIIEKPIKREREDNIKRICSDDGQYAKTECQVIEKMDNDLSLIDVKLYTGRTHQIRVHLSSIGFPLYADSLYGEKIEGQTFILHAKSLEFIHPFSKEKVILSLPLIISKNTF